MKTIPLTKGLHAVVDDEDYDWLMQWKWHARSGRGVLYVAREPSYHVVLLMHRVILNAPDSLEVDHINHNGLDNCRSNPRLVTHAQNCQNRRKPPGGASEYKGVVWSKKQRKWNAHIRVNRILIHLGTYEVEIDAAKAYDAAARFHYGEYAWINFRDDH